MAVYLGSKKVGVIVPIRVPLKTVIYSIDVQNKLVNTGQIITLEDYSDDNIELMSKMLVLLADGGE